MFKSIISRSAMLALVLLAVAAPAFATDPTPSYTVDLAQVTLDITTVITSLITLALVVFGGRKVLSLVKRG